MLAGAGGQMNVQPLILLQWQPYILQVSYVQMVANILPDSPEPLFGLFAFGLRLFRGVQLAER